YGNAPCHTGSGAASKTQLQTFEYFTYGNWSIVDGPSNSRTFTTLFDFSKTDPNSGLPVVGTDHGMQSDFTLTGDNTYTVTMTPLDNPGAAYTRSGTLSNSAVGPIDWIEFTMFNTPTNVAKATDFYVQSIQILSAAAPGVPGDYNNNGVVD